MAKFLFACLFILLSIGLGSTQQCYDCNPQNQDEKCAVIGDEKPTQSDCEDGSVCLALYIEEGEKKGSYRSCFKKGGTGDGCDLYKEMYPELNITKCYSCTGNLCNNHDLKDSGDDGGSNSLNPSLILPLICALSVLYKII